MPPARQKSHPHEFSLRLQEGLDRKGITPPRLAELLKVDPSTVYRWIKEGQIPQPRTVALIAEQLGVRPAWLLGQEEEIAAPTLEKRPRFDYGTNEGNRVAFEYVLEHTPLPILLEQLSKVLNDETQSAEKRVSIAKAIMPMIEKKRVELDAGKKPPE